jgi:LmbE family N-acetylglucosaminyl deacetylase
MSKRILVVASHTDDEVLGCGGTIARHIAEGDIVHIVFMADGVGSRGRDSIQSGALQIRNQARNEALCILGVTNFYDLEFPDNRMDSVPLLEVVQALEPIIEHVQPVRVYTHHYGDLNVDHRITHQAVMTACRPIPGCSVREILLFEVMSSTEWATPGIATFVPNSYVDISDYLPKKLEALAAYHMEMRESPHARSIKNLEYLSRHRGNCLGINAAEAFMVVRIIE